MNKTSSADRQNTEVSNGTDQGAENERSEKRRRCRVSTPICSIVNLVAVRSVLFFDMEVGETGASCYNFHSNSVFHKNRQTRDFVWT